MIAALPLIGSVLSALAPSAPVAAGEAAKTAATAGVDFGQAIQKAAHEALQNVKTAETMSVDGIQGKADLQTVVQSVMTAQESLQAALAIRDKSVAAFQEITRMAI